MKQEDTNTLNFMDGIKSIWPFIGMMILVSGWFYNIQMSITLTTQKQDELITKFDKFITSYNGELASLKDKDSDFNVRLVKLER